MDNPANVPDIDYTPPQPQPESNGTGKKVLIGCSIGCLVLVIIGVIGTFLVVKFGKDWLFAQAIQYTEEQPVEFEEPVADEAAIQALVVRFDAFKDAMENGKDAEPLVLSGEEINLLIYNHPDLADLKGYGQAAIEEDRFTARISVPLDLFADALPEELSERYLNGEATIRFLIDRGFLEVYLVELKGAGKSIPESVMTELRNQDLMKDAKTDQEFQKMIGTLEELKIEGGKLYIVPKPAADRPKP